MAQAHGPVDTLLQLRTPTGEVGRVRCKGDVRTVQLTPEGSLQRGQQALPGGSAACTGSVLTAVIAAPAKWSGAQRRRKAPGEASPPGSQRGRSMM